MGARSVRKPSGALRIIYTRVPYLDLGYSYTCVYICKNLYKYISMYVKDLFMLMYISIKIKKKISFYNIHIF